MFGKKRKQKTIYLIIDKSKSYRNKLSWFCCTFLFFFFKEKIYKKLVELMLIDSIYVCIIKGEKKKKK